MNLSGVATETIINSLRGVNNFGVLIFFLFSSSSMWKKYVFGDFDRYVNFRDWKVSFGAIFNASCVCWHPNFPWTASVRSNRNEWMSCAFNGFSTKANQSSQRSKHVSTRTSAIILISLQIVFCFFSVSIDFCSFSCVCVFVLCFTFTL